MAKNPIPTNNKLAYSRLIVERGRLSGVFPSFHGNVNGDRLVCRGKMQPTELSPCYKVDVSYRYGRSPKVRVIDPRIPYNPAIHMYDDGSLCLFDWREQKWEESFHLYDTVLPWTAEWLLYYEIYLMTGKWIGKSALHATPKEEPETEADE